jgi:hypothetical protein
MQPEVIARIVHCYDPERRRVLCGVIAMTSSTKHPAGVTCPKCLAILAQEASPPPIASDPSSRS